MIDKDDQALLSRKSRPCAEPECGNQATGNDGYCDACSCQGDDLDRCPKDERGAKRHRHGNETVATKPKGDTICVYPGCGESRRTRGLCHGHYQTLRSYIKLGRADEADVVRRGLLLPKGTGGLGKIEIGHDAFLKGSTVRGRA